MPVGALAGATVASAGIGAVASSKASKKAVKAQQQASEANNALQRDIYNQNRDVLSPYIRTGYGATSTLNALLGLPGAQPQQPSALAQMVPGYGPPSGGHAYRGQPMRMRDIMGIQPAPEQPYTDWSSAPLGAVPQNPSALSTLQGVVYGGGGTPSFDEAYENYKRSTGYQTRLQEGIDAIQSSAAARGMLQSGATLKALTRFGQDYATSNFENYLNRISDQQRIGLGGASALAGVGGDYAQSVSANNNAVASARGNSALSGAANLSSVLNTGVSALGLYAGMSGGFGGQSASYASSYGAPVLNGPAIYNRIPSFGS